MINIFGYAPCALCKREHVYATQAEPRVLCCDDCGMRITYARVGPNHFISQLACMPRGSEAFAYKHLGMSRSVGLEALHRALWGSQIYSNQTRAVVARCEGEIIGFFRYSLTRENALLTAHGTWVHRRFRRNGVARELWRLALATPGVRAVMVEAETSAGSALVEALSKEFPRLEWT